MKLTNDDYPQTAVRLLNGAFQRREKADFRLVLENGDACGVHSFVVEMQSKVLQKVLKVDAEVKEFAVKGCSKQALGHLVEFLYKGEVDLASNDLANLARLANQLNVDKVRERCLQMLKRVKLGNHEFLDALELCVELGGAEELGSLVEHHEPQFLEFLQCDDVGGLSIDSVECLMRIDTPATEDVLLSTLFKWFQSQQGHGTTVEQRAELVSQLRPELVSQEKLKTLLAENCELIKNRTHFLDAFLKAGTTGAPRRPRRPAQSATDSTLIAEGRVSKSDYSCQTVTPLAEDVSVEAKGKM